MPNSTFSRNFGPLLGNGYSDQQLRVSDAERQAVADRLAEHYGDGRLDQAEFDERAGQAMSAKTRADLAGLLDDLPEPGPGGVPGAPVRRDRAMRRHRHGHGLLAVIAIAVIVVAAAHAVVWFAVSWLWLGILAIIALAVTGRLGDHHYHHHSDGH